MGYAIIVNLDPSAGWTGWDGCLFQFIQIWTFWTDIRTWKEKDLVTYKLVAIIPSPVEKLGER